LSHLSFAGIEKKRHKVTKKTKVQYADIKLSFLACKIQKHALYVLYNNFSTLRLNPSFLFIPQTGQARGMRRNKGAKVAMLMNSAD